MTFLLLAVAFPGGLSSQNDSSNDAAAEYRAGLDLRQDSAKARPHFVRAAEIYEQMWANGARTAAVARNMAQARLLAGDIGRAIGDYRRGLRLMPHDPGLRGDLDQVREHVSYPLTGDMAQAARPREPVSPIDRAGVPMTVLALATLVIWALGWFTVARAWLGVRGGLAIVGGAMILVAILLGAALWWEDDRAHARWSAPAAVVVSPVELRTGNSDEYPRRIEGRLPAGVELHLLGERGGWLHVELADGTVGWAPRSRVAVVD